MSAIAKQLVRFERAWASRGGGGLPWHILWQIYTVQAHEALFWTARLKKLGWGVCLAVEQSGVC